MTNFTLGRGAAKWLGCGALACAAAACASNPPPAKEPVAMGEMTRPGPQAPEGRTASTRAGQPRNDADTTIRISEEIRTQCALPNAPQDAPHFDYADAALRAHGANVLDDVAACLSRGPLKGRTLTIIGRTDPRGSAEYNKELSANRAEAARAYLLQRGVPSDSVNLIARGEVGAQGTDEETWAMDRRVDFELSERSAGTKPTPGNFNASPDPVMEGTRLQALSPGNTSKANGASYSDSAEGGHEAGAAKGSGKGSGSASGSVHVGTGK